MRAKILHFHAANDEDMLMQYLKAKYSIFYKDQGMSSLMVDKKNEVACIDNYDISSNFTYSLVNGTVAGFLRDTDCKNGFPHASLFEKYSETVTKLKTASLNALCVYKYYRGKYYIIGRNEEKLSYAMMKESIHRLKENNYDLIITSTSDTLARKMFLPLGFVVLESGVKYELSTDPISNLVLLLTERSRSMFPCLNY